MIRKIILAALAICSCSKPDLPIPELEESQQSYGTEDIILLRKDGSEIFSAENSYYNPWKEDTLLIYPYPNTASPVIVESVDSSKMIPSLIDEHMLLVDLLAPGKTGLVVTCEGVSKKWNINVERKLYYDFKYDPSTDRFTLDFAQNPSYPIEEDFWGMMAAELHITIIWSYKVGYGSNYMNTRYPRTTVINGEFPVSSSIFLENLEKEYKNIKKLYDEEFAIEYAKDPKHDWKTWSGIELKVVIRNPKKQLIMAHSKGSDSAYAYNLGFKLSHSVIEN